MAPFFQIIPPADGRKEAEVRAIDMPNSLRSDEERKAEAMRLRAEEREAERYATLVARPHPQEGIVITEETRKRLAQSEAEKAAVPNVVTTHSDIAKVAAGSDIALVPTVNVYTQDNPMDEGSPQMAVEDRTVTLHGIVQGETVLDRAETSLRQPVGDEYSARSATGPTLPEGQVLGALAEEEETEPAFDPEQSGSERLEQRQEESAEAEAAAAKEVEKQVQEQEKAAEQAEKRGETGVAGTKSTESGTQAKSSSSGSKSSGSKSSSKSTSKGKGK